MQSRLIPWIVDDFVGDDDASVADIAFELGSEKMLALAHRTEKVIVIAVLYLILFLCLLLQYYLIVIMFVCCFGCAVKY